MGMGLSREQSRFAAPSQPPQAQAQATGAQAQPHGQPGGVGATGYEQQGANTGGSSGAAGGERPRYFASIFGSGDPASQ